MSSVMSRPYAFPEGPTRRADNKKSMPPPDPRSRTVSPGSRLASAVGLPHPSEAFSAASGICPAWASSYRLEVMGSQHPSSADLAPQQPLLPPDVTRRAASPHLAFTVSFNCILILASCYRQSWTMVRGSTALFRV